MSWLVTAFEPFAGAQTNSSLVVLEQLRSQDWGGRIHFASRPIPTTFAGAWSAVKREIATHPDLKGVVALGQASGRSRISLERVALNWVDTQAPDNSGFLPAQGPIELRGPQMRWSNIPWEKAPKRGDLERSYSAGTYVCNTLLYWLTGWAEAEKKYAGFVHIPALLSQNLTGPAMPDETATACVAELLAFLEAL